MCRKHQPMNSRYILGRSITVLAIKLIIGEAPTPVRQSSGRRQLVHFESELWPRKKRQVSSNTIYVRNNYLLDTMSDRGPGICVRYRKNHRVSRDYTVLDVLHSWAVVTHSQSTNYGCDCNSLPAATWMSRIRSRRS